MSSPGPPLKPKLKMTEVSSARVLKVCVEEDGQPADPLTPRSSGTRARKVDFCRVDLWDTAGGPPHQGRLSHQSHSDLTEGLPGLRPSHAQRDLLRNVEPSYKEGLFLSGEIRENSGTGWELDFQVREKKQSLIFGARWR